MSELVTIFPEKLKQYYQGVYDSTMKDIPICNHHLSIDVLHWQTYGESGQLGVLITPWFISLVMQPAENVLTDDLKIGHVVEQSFPSGKYEFLVNYQEALGFYLTCALISETKLIVSHEVACALAQEMLVYLFEQKQVEKLQPVARSALEQTISNAENQLDKPMSRRALVGLRSAEPA